jgi:CRP/FNR family transcriptional regulator, cyclic AMP receptor protein
MNIEVKTTYLRSYNLISDLTEIQFKELCEYTKLKKAKKGETLYFTNDNEKKVFFLIKGRIKICEMTGEGHERIKEFLNEGDIFGQISPSNYSDFEYADAFSDEVIYCVIGLREFERIMESNPKLTLKIVKSIGEKLRKLEDKYFNMVSKDVKSRLIYFFMDWAKTEGKRFGNRVILRNYLTHNEIANMIASSRQTVTGILNELKEAGEINYSRHQIIFPDITLLNKN